VPLFTSGGSWSCYSVVSSGLGLKNLVLFTSLTISRIKIQFGKYTLLKNVQQSCTVNELLARDCRRGYIFGTPYW